MASPYQILGIKAGASNAEIKNAYRGLAKKYHPDISKEPDAESKFIEITEAYELLTEGPPIAESAIDFSDEVLSLDYEDIRRERARAYAKMRYEAFKKNNDAFTKAWYYEPVKYGTYFMIFISYGLALAMFLAPILAWIITRNPVQSAIMMIVTLFSAHVYRYARDLHKEVKPYFADYN
ncbi:Chaperone protein DnaJ [Flammeovirgaceae bacterium 311]|nr:Chaperone protein DnaJ [Flammeovirgaceae bacterium 311]